MKKLFTNSIYNKLAIVQFLIYFGSFFSTVAIYTLVIKLDATPTQIAISSVAFLLPSLFGFLTGAVVDKYLSKAFMSTVLLFEAIFSSLVLYIDSIEQFWLLIAFIVLRSSCSFMFFAAQMALFPQIAKDIDELKELNSLHSMIWSINFALGMSVGGLVVKAIGVYGAILVDVAVFVVAFLIFLSIDINIKAKSIHSITKLIKEGISYLKSKPLTLKLMFLHASIALTNFDTIINLLAKYQYAVYIAVPLTIGFLNATRALALMFGAVFMTKYINKNNLEFFLVLQGLAIILWSILQNHYWGSIISMLLVGFLTTVLWSYTYTLMQTSVEKEYLGRVVAYSDTVFMSISMSVSFLSGYLYEIGLSISFITATLGIGFFIFALFYKRLKSQILY